MQENNHLIEHYKGYDEDGRLSSRRGSVEFLTTMRFIEKYIKPCDRIIEIGAATGRYSHALARQGYRVDAVELVQSHIEIFKKSTQPGENVTITQGNAIDLSEFADNAYDITLLLGPMYHLYNTKDKQTALSEAIRVTKRGGIIFVAYCISDATILSEFFASKRWDINEFIEKGMINPETFATHSEPKDLFELVRREDVFNLMSDFPITRLHYVATDGFTRHIDEAIKNMDDAMFELYLKYHFAICEREDMVGISHHTLDIFSKD